MNGDHNRMSDIFHNVQERLLTAVLVYVSYPTPPTGELKEYEIGDMAPDSTIADVEARFGDGAFRLVGVGSERSENGSIRRVTRDTRTLRVAKNLGSPWEEAVKNIIKKQFPGHDHGSTDDAELDLSPGIEAQDRRNVDYGTMFDSMRTSASSTPHFMAEPIVVPLGGDENLVVAKGLSAEELQQRIDEAQSRRRKEKEEQSMNDRLMAMMAAQMASANAEKELAQRRAEESNKMMMEVLLGGGRKQDTSASDDARVRGLTDMVDNLRRQMAEMEDRSRRTSAEHWDEIDRWKRRTSELEDQWRAERRKNEELTSKLAKADIDAMLAGAKGPGGDSDEEKLQRKVAMFAQLAQGLAPVAGPILAKLGIIPEPPPSAPQIQGGDPSAGMPTGDIGGGHQ